MEDDKPKPQPFLVGGDISDLSVGDIDERIAMLEQEIERLKQERGRKEGSLSAAEAFFKQG